MKLLSTLLTLAGYTLLYAATANHGRFATNPWMGLFRDAYGVDSTTPQQQGLSPSITQRLKNVAGQSRGVSGTTARYGVGGGGGTPPTPTTPKQQTKNVAGRNRNISGTSARYGFGAGSSIRPRPSTP